MTLAERVEPERTIAPARMPQADVGVAPSGVAPAGMASLAPPMASAAIDLGVDTPIAGHAEVDEEADAGEPVLDPRQVAERISRLVDDIGATADPRMAEKAEDLVSVLMQFYGAGLRRMLQLADEAGSLEGALLDGIVADELVSSILILHDLHPLDLPSRVQAALDRVRPYLGSHGGDVEILGIEGDVVRLRMAGSCSTCPSSTVTLNFAIEEAILKAAPEISRIDAENVEAGASAPLIQLQSRDRAEGGADAAAAAIAGPTRWLVLAPGLDIQAEAPAAVDVGGLSVAIFRAGADLFAYRDRCPNCRSGVTDGRFLGTVLTCKVCGHAFDVRRAGRSTDDGPLHLEPLPLLVEAGKVRIAVPAGAA